MTPSVNKPTDIRQKEADVNRKLQLYGIISAFKAGKVPSNDQIDIALNSFLESKPLSSPSPRLSAEGRGLVADVNDVVKHAKNLLLSKNEGNLLQDFIWQTQQFDPKAISTPNATVTKEQAHKHGNQVLDGLRTLGTLIITNGQFRKLLKDATLLLRDMASDAAVDAADKIRPSQEDLSQVDNPAADNTWHDPPDVSKDAVRGKLHDYYNGGLKQELSSSSLEESQDAHRSRSRGRTETARPLPQSPQNVSSSGSSSIGGAMTAKDSHATLNGSVDSEAKDKSRAKKDELRERAKDYFSRKMPPERRDQTIWRLKKMVLECQQHPDYYQAVQTLLDIAEEYGSRANRLARGGAGAVRDAHASLVLAETDLKTLIERFANGTSTDDLWAAVSKIYDAADHDPQLKDWFKALNAHIRRCLQEQGYILTDESNLEWTTLHDEGNYLLRNKYRGHTDRVVDEIKFLADQFDQDPHNKAFAASLTKLFTALGNDEKGNATFKPHLIKDLTDVILPGIFEKVAYIPVPRIEYSDDQFDAVVENLVLESDNFMPNVLEIASENYMRFGRKKIASKSQHSIDVKVAGIQMDLRDVSYYIKRKHGFPAITDQGVANFLLAGDGFAFRMKLSSPDKKDKHSFFKIDEVDVAVNNLKIKLIESNHKMLFTIFKPLMLKALRPALQKAMEKAIKDQAAKLDTMLFQIKQEADRALERSRGDPETTPNVYQRYVKAAQKRILQGKKKKARDAAAKAAAATDKKINYAVTKEKSMFPHIHLPGGISSKATEYRDLAHKGHEWESPVFSIGDAAPSRDIPPAPTIVRKTRRTAAASSAVSTRSRGGAANGDGNVSDGSAHTHAGSHDGDRRRGLGSRSGSGVGGTPQSGRGFNGGGGFRAHLPAFDPAAPTAY